MFSQTIIVGRFARDPEVSTTNGQNPKAKAVFTIAWDHPYKKDNSQFTRCVAWGKTAETIGKYCKKGRTVTVTGVLVNNQWEKTVGNEKVNMNSPELEVDQIRFIDAANSGTNTQQQQQQPAWGSQGFGRIEPQPQAQQPQQPQVQQPQQPQAPQAPQVPNAQPQFSNPGEPINQPGTMNPAAFQQTPQYTPEQIHQMQQHQLQQQQMQQQQQQQFNPQAQQGMQQQVNPHYNPQTQPQMGLPTQQNPYPGVEEDDLPF